MIKKEVQINMINYEFKINWRLRLRIRWSILRHLEENIFRVEISMIDMIHWRIWKMIWSYLLLHVISSVFIISKVSVLEEWALTRMQERFVAEAQCQVLFLRCIFWEAIICSRRIQVFLQIFRWSSLCSFLLSS